MRFLFGRTKSHKKGSVAGVVTLDEVINEQAISVGTALARLIATGFNIFSANELARNEALIGNNYLVLGDGMFTITQGDDLQPTIVCVDPLDNDKYGIEVWTDDKVGQVYMSMLFDGEIGVLEGNHVTKKLTKRRLLKFVTEHSGPIIYESKLLWSEEFIEKLTSE